MVKTLDLLKRLSDIPGISGDEKNVRAEIEKQIEQYCEYKIDPLGNLIAFKRGDERPKNKVMLSAHMDEVGFIITHIEDSGLLRFACVGGIDPRVIIGKTVEIGCKRVCGVIGAKATHQTEEKEREEAVPADKLYIDIGASGKDDALKHVKQGDRAVFSAELLDLGKGKILGRAFDDRAGCAIMISLIQSDLPYDCIFAFTVQEEIGCVGAKAAAYTVDPDISIVLEATTASDIAGVEPDMAICEQGKGAVISFMDKGAVYDYSLYNLALETANKNKIPCQTKSGVFGGNDSSAIQVSRGGVRTLAVSLPCRYIHTASCVLCKKDIESTLELVEKLIPEVCVL